jgi:putative sensory transduction regulator
MIRPTPILAACLLALSWPATAADELIFADNPSALVALIQDLGFQAKLDKDGVGDPLIRSSAGGVDFSIQFYGCTKNKRCDSLHFVVGYDLDDGATLEAIEAWNEGQRYASGYLDDENDPFLQLDLNMVGGLTRANFESTFDLWQTIKAEFEEHIGFDD